MEPTLLVLLILINGLFAMSEMALSASRKARLQVMVEAGEPGAQAAMDLHENPTKFLSTVQIGITSIGVLNGIVGEAAFAAPLGAWITLQFGIGAATAGYVATALVVLMITVLTIIFGELVPKRLGQLYPERVARLVAPPMMALSSATRPLVGFLSLATEGILRLIGIREDNARAVTQEEIAASLEEGVDAGVIERQEHQMVRNVFRLDDRQIGSMMIPRAEIEWVDIEAPLAALMERATASGHTRVPVCRGSLDDVVGVLGLHRLLPALSRGETPQLAQLVDAPVFVPETLSGMELLEHFRGSSAELVFVVDEYGAVQGVITERDLLEAIIGEFVTAADDDGWAVRRADGSWLMDGLIPVPELKDRLEIKELPEEDRGRYNTLAGMIMLLLGRLPNTTDSVDWGGWRFEVVDLDGKRVDKVLVAPIESPHDLILRRERLINQNLHRKPVPLDPTQHRALKIEPVTDWSVAARLNAMFVAATEFPDVCKEYPIVFVRAGREADGRDQIAPIAVLGVMGEQNLYLEGKSWRANYIPAVLRAYPFCVGRIDEQRFAVCVDMAWPGAGENNTGQPLFDATGQPSELLKAMQQHLEVLEGEIQGTRRAGARLLELDLLRDMRFDATLPDGRQHTVDGFLTVDQEKAQNLPDAVVGELHRTGVLGLVQLHWASLGLMRRLMDWHLQRAAAPAVA